MSLIQKCITILKGRPKENTLTEKQIKESILLNIVSIDNTQNRQAFISALSSLYQLLDDYLIFVSALGNLDQQFPDSISTDLNYRCHTLEWNGNQYNDLNEVNRLITYLSQIDYSNADSRDNTHLISSRINSSNLRTYLGEKHYLQLETTILQMGILIEAILNSKEIIYTYYRYRALLIWFIHLLVILDDEAFNTELT